MKRWVFLLTVVFAFLAILSVNGIAKDESEIKKILNQPSTVVIDVRSADEFASGHIDQAILIPHDEIAGKINASVLSKNTPIVLYCRSGRRAEIAKATLEKMGYRRVVNAGGIGEFKSIMRR